MRKVAELAGLCGDSAKVYRDSEWQEWRVKFFAGGVYQPDSDYHTTDKQDALDTGNAWLIKQDDDRRN
ncbi:hypothetical protein [Pseudomonas phage Achelous]|uniref:Uncharacterized protein n=1 Tax=Pseudomonas phage Achelous TaxID=2163982 RepID=A0A2S1GMS8_9CAUD|nr:hypothetical protein HOT10_gp02 [Pseudomonas phage Achelous]AWD90679.1 hypothetical protein [Pseudomonas phage Achelous]